ncbi:MAG: hypothetical protein L0228_13515 [Planctomycetes bacterium]|nr:hypothetical protein [Planctomycetota bacterium]
MKRTLVVLALAAISSAGCRAMDAHRGQGCGEPCGAACEDECCEPCHVTTARHAPRPIGPNGFHGGGRGGNLEASCPGGNGCCFDRYCGSQCGPGCHPGPYDCSPCYSPHWGCTGHRHPAGYKDGRGCLCQGQIPGHCPQPGPHCPCCGHGYCCSCCGPPAPGCPCCCCGGASGDHNYNFMPGPPVAQTAYPYYTLRGPRDFLLDNPPSIGPY